MRHLIITLRAQHQAILQLMAGMDEAVARADERAVRAQLVPIAELLLSHMEFEDREFYPAVTSKNRQAVTPEQIDFAHRIAEGTEQVRAFFARHATGPFDLEAFSRDWPAIVSHVGSRILAEEATLFPLYEMLTQQPPARRAG